MFRTMGDNGRVFCTKAPNMPKLWEILKGGKTQNYTHCQLQLQPVLLAPRGPERGR